MDLLEKTQDMSNLDDGHRSQTQSAWACYPCTGMNKEACLPPTGMLSSLGIQFYLVLKAELGLRRCRVSPQTFSSQYFRYLKLL